VFPVTIATVRGRAVKARTVLIAIDTQKFQSQRCEGGRLRGVGFVYTPFFGYSFQSQRCEGGRLRGGRRSSFAREGNTSCFNRNAARAAA